MMYDVSHDQRRPPLERIFASIVEQERERERDEDEGDADRGGGALERRERS